MIASISRKQTKLKSCIRTSRLVAFFNTNPTSIRTALAEKRNSAHEHLFLSCHSSDTDLLAATGANKKGRSISSSEDIARVFTVSYNDYSLILRRPSTCLSAYFWMHIAGQRITEERARALFRQALELVEQNEPRDREQLKFHLCPGKAASRALQALASRAAALLLYKLEGFSSLEIGHVVRT